MLGNTTRYGALGSISLDKENTIAAHKELCKSIESTSPDSLIQNRIFQFNVAFQSSTIPSNTQEYCKNSLHNDNPQNNTDSLYQKISLWSHTLQDVSKDIEKQALYNNSDIKIYSYRFKFIEMNKFFRHSDIFQIVPNYQSMPVFIRATYSDKHTQFGIFTSFQKLDLESLNIAHIPYTLKLRYKFIIHVIIILLVLGMFAVFFTFYTLMPLRIDSAKFIQKDLQSPLLETFISSSLFALYCIFIALLIVSSSVLFSIYDDDWSYAHAHRVFYQPYEIIGNFWSRGRHFVDILVSLHMRPLGQFFVSFGFSPLRVQEFFSAFFNLIFYFLLFISVSLLVWILNHRENFQKIFVVSSLCCLYCFSYIAHYNTVAAYVGTAGFSLLYFLPIAYFFLYNKEFYIIRPSISGYCVLFFLAYAACFVTETSSLPIFGLSLFILAYYFIKYRENVSLAHAIFLRIIFIIILVPLAFILTLLSGRGRAQIEGTHDTSLLDSIINGFSNNPTLNKWIIIISVLYLIVLFYKILRNKLANKQEYFIFSLLVTGLLGNIGFSAIRVNVVSFETILLFIALFATVLQLNKHHNVTIRFISHFAVISLIVCLSLQAISQYQSHFSQYANRSAQQNLIVLLQEAERKGLDRLTLTKEEALANKLELLGLNDNAKSFHNKSITEWMYYYGYTTKPIPIQIIDDELSHSHK
ncbi:hypothetical protein CQA66_07335 [Helicobacter aurati]|uniref:Uncharacterized protein n=1 Tax=Helicobacter aurati TaxID=137778 RepID=A0A3D8J0G1_9HELI|nr:hypothetical protein [Helicobacter aurati]RDU71019.1 hypothetical protein CQA66_07335 [Helicobacter aurati]